MPQSSNKLGKIQRALSDFGADTTARDRVQMASLTMAMAKKQPRKTRAAMER